MLCNVGPVGLDTDSVVKNCCDVCAVISSVGDAEVIRLFAL